jgi:hypothetical protein
MKSLRQKRLWHPSLLARKRMSIFLEGRQKQKRYAQRKF